MKRKTCEARKDWQMRVNNIGLTFHTDPTGPYWDETAYYEFTKEEIQAIEKATSELYQMCLKAVDKVVKDKNLLKLFCATEELCEYVVRSWENCDPPLYGRFDFSFHNGIPKLLEFNADTPTCLVEASVAQWFWFNDKFGEGPEAEKYDQFNSLHQNLIDRWKSLASSYSPLSSLSRNLLLSLPTSSSPSPSLSTPSTPSTLPADVPTSSTSSTSTTSTESPSPIKFHFSCVSMHEEDFRTINYLVDVALQAGIDGTSLFISDIGWNKEKSCFVDLKEEPITHLFKLYPWEWLTREGFSQQLIHEKHNMQIIEPPWKMILSNKNILPILWEMFPDHPNLLACYWENNISKFEGKYVKKPVLGREGNNVSIVVGDEVKWKTEGEYGNEGFIYQEVCLIPDFEGNRPLIGSWLIGDKPSGIGIREDNGPITRDESRFVPHVYTL